MTTTPAPSATDQRPRAPHTPLDSLTYVNASASALEWVTEELDGAHGDEPDVDVCISMLTAFASLIRAETRLHGRSSHYSTGAPVYVDERRRRIETGHDGEPDQIVWFTCRRVCPPHEIAPEVDDDPT